MTLDYTTCEHTGKRRYTSRKAARRAAAIAHPGARLTVYECTACGGWHYGHLPKMVRDGDAVRWELQPRV